MKDVPRCVFCGYSEHFWKHKSGNDRDYHPFSGGTCARYWGSDGTLCSTHHGRFANGWQGPPYCDAAA